MDAILHWRIPVAVLGWLGGTNLLLGVFNLLPGAPLDGGRVLQAALWWRTGTGIVPSGAADARQVVGMVLAAVGWWTFVKGMSGGLWLMVIGLFVASAAAAERRWAQLATALRGVRVAQAMTRPVVTGPDWLTVDRFLSEAAAQVGHSVLPLLDFEGRPSGVVRLRRLAAVPSARRERCGYGGGHPVSQCTIAAPDELLTAVLERLGSGGGLPILVMDGGRLDGIVTTYDIDRLSKRRRRGPDHGGTFRRRCRPPGE